jgi:hypothetical protein
MESVSCEIRRDPESRRLWGLEMFDHEIIGCAGPFLDETALPAQFEESAFERNAELLRWLSRRGLQRLPHLPRATTPGGR